MDETYGRHSSNAIRIRMEMATRSAMKAIRGLRHTHSVTSKPDTEDGSPDFVTDADITAQKIYFDKFKKQLPTIGFVAEEGNLYHPSTGKDDFWFCVDPLDGTNAFARLESRGVTTMCAFVNGHTVVGACVGDPMTGDIISLRADTGIVSRISDNFPRELAINPVLPLAQQYVYLQDHPKKYSLAVQRLIGSLPETDNHFKSIEITSGGIGAVMSRLWQGNIGAVILHGGIQHPWDLAPVYGISKALGFVYLAIAPTEPLTFATFEPAIEKNDTRIPFEHIIIHKSRLEELYSWTDWSK